VAILFQENDGFREQGPKSGMKETRLKLAIGNWSAWQPGNGQSSICRGSRFGQTYSHECDSPDVGMVPALQRRRLSSLARVAFHLLGQCTDPQAQEPVVLSSVMGEINRTQHILEAIAADEPVSPASFSLSVHNAIGGLWSVINKIQAPVLALAPPDYSPVPALLEASGLLAEGGYPAVNVLYCEEKYPDFYLPFLDSPSFPVALAVRLVPNFDPSGVATKVIELSRVDGPAESSSWKLLEDLAKLLAGDRNVLVLPGPSGTWRLERIA